MNQMSPQDETMRLNRVQFSPPSQTQSSVDDNEETCAESCEEDESCDEKPFFGKNGEPSQQLSNSHALVYIQPVASFDLTENQSIRQESAQQKPSRGHLLDSIPQIEHIDKPIRQEPTDKNSTDKNSSQDLLGNILPDDSTSGLQRVQPSQQHFSNIASQAAQRLNLSMYLMYSPSVPFQFKIGQSVQDISQLLSRYKTFCTDVKVKMFPLNEELYCHCNSEKEAKKFLLQFETVVLQYLVHCMSYVKNGDLVYESLLLSVNFNI